MDGELSAIQERNKRVEADKAWETSLTRRLVIAAGTYVIVTLYLSFIGVEKPWMHAAVPAGAYLISTFSLTFIKNIWITKLYKRS